KIKVFFTEDETGKQIYSNMNTCNNINHHKQIIKDGSIRCMPKITKEEEKRKKNVKRSDCSDYVYSTQHVRCIKKDGALYSKLDEAEKQIADMRNCDYKKVSNMKNGKVINRCESKDQDKLDKK